MVTDLRRWALAIAIIASATAFAAEPDEHDFVVSDGVRIHYYTMGDSGSWVVLIHGYTDSGNRMWFRTGIGQELARNHRVVALDNRNHGKSDKPQRKGPGRAEDVLELMDHLDIEKAHIHGYSMGGGITGRLLASYPERFITAGFGGSGIYEEDEELRAQAAERDPEMPEPTGFAAEAFKRLRASAREASENAGEDPEARRRRFRTPPDIDLSSITVPVIAINGEFDRPYSRTQRMEREIPTFKNVILAGKNHMTAVGVGAPMDETYVREMVAFINAHDE